MYSPLISVMGMGRLSPLKLPNRRSRSLSPLLRTGSKRQQQRRLMAATKKRQLSTRLRHPVVLLQACSTLPHRHAKQWHTQQPPHHLVQLALPLLLSASRAPRPDAARRLRALLSTLSHQVSLSLLALHTLVVEAAQPRQSRL